MTSEGILIIWKLMKKDCMVIIGSEVRVGDPGAEAFQFSDVSCEVSYPHYTKGSKAPRPAHWI